MKNTAMKSFTLIFLFSIIIFGFYDKENRKKQAPKDTTEQIP
jgi:hypothetical protein